MSFNPAEWANKLQLTIDSSKIDGDLTDFPVLITLSSGTGIDNFDATDVFDELGSDANRKKIAITTISGAEEIELYVEIERWDDANEQAWLWTKVPTIVSGTDTVLNLYYDSTQTTNSGFIGDTTETPAQNVWSNGFIGVWHLAQAPGGGAGCIKDSTSNGYHAADIGAGATSVNGKIGKAIELLGTNQRIETSYFSTPTALFTLECLFNVEDTGTSYEALIGNDDTASERSWQWRVEQAGSNTDKINFVPFIEGSPVSIISDSTVRVGYHYTAVTYNNGVCDLYLDGSPDRATYEGSGSVTAATHGVSIGSRGPGESQEALDGIADESRLSSVERSAAWVKATYNSYWDSIITFKKGWFDPNDWANTLQITIDSSKVDEDLTDFPVLIPISSSAGIDDTDVTAIFDELITVSGTKKIAITTTVSGIETELYTEIERWDWTNEQAWLWTKVPTIVSGTDTILNFYYDSTQTTNSGYIGDTGDIAAQTVWNDNFVGVWHLAQDPNGDVADCMLDSTSNENHGTPGGAMTSEDLVDGKVGKALIFDTNDYINVPHNAVFNITDAITIELQANIHNITPSNNAGLIAKDHATSWDCALYAGQTGNLAFIINGTAASTGINAVVQNTWHYIVFAYDKDAGGTEEMRIDVDTQNKGTGNYDTAIGTDSDAITIAKYATQYLDTTIDEVRISKIDRSIAWKKATYHSNWDSLITFSEGVVSYYFSGYVYEQGNPIVRTLYSHMRDTGVLTGSTTSSGNGYYYLETTYSGSHYIVCLDDEAGESYNDLIIGNIYPTTV